MVNALFIAEVADDLWLILSIMQRGHEQWIPVFRQ